MDCRGLACATLTFRRRPAYMNPRRTVTKRRRSGASPQRGHFAGKLDLQSCVEPAEQLLILSLTLVSRINWLEFTLISFWQLKPFRGNSFP